MKERERRNLLGVLHALLVSAYVRMYSHSCFRSGLFKSIMRTVIGILSHCETTRCFFPSSLQSAGKKILNAVASFNIHQNFLCLVLPQPFGSLHETVVVALRTSTSSILAFFNDR